jgi:hypothetical protein
MTSLTKSESSDYPCQDEAASEISVRAQIQNLYGEILMSKTCRQISVSFFVSVLVSSRHL